MIASVECLAIDKNYLIGDYSVMDNFIELWREYGVHHPRPNGLAGGGRDDAF